MDDNSHTFLAFDYWAQNPILSIASAVVGAVTAVAMFRYFWALPSSEIRDTDLVSSWALCSAIVATTFLAPSLVGGDPRHVSPLWNTLICILTTATPVQAIGWTLTLFYVKRAVTKHPGGQPNIENIVNE
jgi:hypothetical protein